MLMAEAVNLQMHTGIGEPFDMIRQLGGLKHQRKAELGPGTVKRKEHLLPKSINLLKKMG